MLCSPTTWYYFVHVRPSNKYFRHLILHSAGVLPTLDRLVVGCARFSSIPIQLLPKRKTQKNRVCGMRACVFCKSYPDTFCTSAVRSITCSKVIFSKLLVFLILNYQVCEFGPVNKRFVSNRALPETFVRPRVTAGAFVVSCVHGVDCDDELNYDSSNKPATTRVFCLSLTFVWWCSWSSSPEVRYKKALFLDTTHTWTSCVSATTCHGVKEAAQILENQVACVQLMCMHYWQSLRVTCTKWSCCQAVTVADGYWQ